MADSVTVYVRLIPGRHFKSLKSIEDEIVSWLEDLGAKVEDIHVGDPWAEVKLDSDWTHGPLPGAIGDASDSEKG